MIASQTAARKRAPIRPRTGPLRDWLDFASALVRKNAIKGDVVTSLQHIGQRKRNCLRELWELTELSASAFADEVAVFISSSASRFPTCWPPAR